MPIVDKYKDMGTVVMGKVEAGEAKKGQSLLVMPNRVSIVHFNFNVFLFFFFSNIKLNTYSIVFYTSLDGSDGRSVMVGR